MGRNPKARQYFAVPSSQALVPEFSLVVGVDLIRIGEVNESIDRFGDRYLRRIFTGGEIDYCQQDPQRVGERFAARFAAKEATMKALRVRDTDALDWRSIEIRRAPEGWCEIVLHDAANALARREGISGLAVSMSHEREFATATVVGRRDA